MRIISFKQNKETKELSAIIDHIADSTYEFIKNFKEEEKLKYFPKINMDIHLYQDEYDHYINMIRLQDTEDKSKNKIISIDDKRITCGIMKYLLINADMFKFTDTDKNKLFKILFG